MRWKKAWKLYGVWRADWRKPVSLLLGHQPRTPSGCWNTLRRWGPSLCTLSKGSSVFQGPSDSFGPKTQQSTYMVKKWLNPAVAFFSTLIPRFPATFYLVGVGFCSSFSIAGGDFLVNCPAVVVVYGWFEYSRLCEAPNSTSMMPPPRLIAFNCRPCTSGRHKKRRILVPAITSWSTFLSSRTTGRGVVAIRRRQKEQFTKNERANWSLKCWSQHEEAMSGRTGDSSRCLDTDWRATLR